MRTGKRPTKITDDGQGGNIIMETCQSCRGNQTVDSFIFCETCITIICEGCRASRHGHHKTNRLNVAASDVKKILLGHASPQAGPVKIKDIQAVEQLTQSLKDELLTLETDTVEKIKKHISALKEQLDDICNSLIHNVSEVVSTELKSLRKMEGEAKKLAASISDMCEQAGQLSRDQDDFNVVLRGFSLCEELREAIDTKLPTPVKGPSFSIKYLPGSINRSSLEDMCGENTKIRCVDEFQVRNDLIGLAIGTHGANIQEARRIEGIIKIKLDKTTCTFKVHGKIGCLMDIDGTV